MDTMTAEQIKTGNYGRFISLDIAREMVAGCVVLWSGAATVVVWPDDVRAALVTNGDAVWGEYVGGEFVSDDAETVVSL